MRGTWMAIGAVALAASLAATPATAQESDFQAWLDGVRDEAREKGIAAETLDAALADVRPIERVIELDRSQPEFIRTFWSYMDNRVTPGRVEKGRRLLKKHRDLLQKVQREHGVQPRFLIAFWGMETGFGDHLGSFPVIGSVATLAHDDRRGDFFRTQLFHALRIVDEGHIEPSAFEGSWAGATGHLQFLPSTFTRHAVDADGDGRKDIWGDLRDVFASGANYLSQMGWEGDERWGREVRLPEDFPWKEAQLDVKKTLDSWAEMGVRKANGEPLPAPEGWQGSIVLPQGHEGPAFLVYENFRHILSWNRSVKYGVAVGQLADRIAGMPKIRTGRDTDSGAVSFEQVERIQTLLNELGHEAGPVDGVPGESTRAAIRRFQLANQYPADGYASPRLLERLKARATPGEG